MKKRRLFFKMTTILIAIIILVVFIVIYSLISQERPMTTKYEISSNKIDTEFDGFKILQIADLHNTKFGENQEHLVSEIKKNNPDIIVFTGDFIDYRRFFDDIKIIDNEIATKDNDIPIISLLNQLKDYPVYMIYGNHETVFINNKSSRLLLNKIEKTGAKFINGKNIKIEKGESFINLLGVYDPTTIGNKSISDSDKIKGQLDDFNLNFKEFNILLSHRPELLTSTYSEYSLDIVFTGHAHGGQVRLPFIQGLFAPHQGVFPKYTKGVYYNGNVSMIVSAGLGDSSFPIRILNRPEIVLITLNR